MAIELLAMSPSRVVRFFDRLWCSRKRALENGRQRELELGWSRGHPGSDDRRDVKRPKNILWANRTVCRLADSQFRVPN